MIWGTFALAFAAAFTGASFYVNWVEQPARLKLDEEALLGEWGPSDSRGILLLAALALLLPLAAQDSEPHKVTEPGVTMPRIVHKVEPKYSKKARKKRIEGTVTLSIVIGPDGIGKDFQVKKSLDPDLDANAIEAVKQWRFKPSTKDGEPVAVYATIEVSFHLI